jgi:hypothetical protein
MAKNFSNNQEFYTHIESLIKELREIGNSEWASQIEDALRCGSTSGEILGGIRLELIKLQRTDIPLKIKLQPGIEAVINTLDETLGYWRPE